MGIGASLVEAFAYQGSRVIFLDIADNDSNALIRRLSKQGVSHVPTFMHCDLTDIDGAVKPAAAKILLEHTRVDAVVNNCGNDARQPTLGLTYKQWEQGIALNLNHQLFLTQSLMPGLIAAGSSSVVNMGSITWAIPGTGLVPYIASKSAIVGLTKTLAHEFGPMGVRVNSIMPGAIATERQTREVITREYQSYVLGRQALKRILQPEEVSRLVLWLVADDSSGVSSQSIVVDAGWI